MSHLRLAVKNRICADRPRGPYARPHGPPVRTIRTDRPYGPSAWTSCTDPFRTDRPCRFAARTVCTDRPHASSVRAFRMHGQFAETYGPSVRTIRTDSLY